MSHLFLVMDISSINTYYSIIISVIIYIIIIIGNGYYFSSFMKTNTEKTSL